MTQSRKILYIEDDRDNREMIGMIIEARDSWSMMEAATGKEGIESARSLVPDLILLDISLPDLSGYEVLNQLKTDPKTTQIPVIALTGSHFEDETLQDDGWKFDGFLAKPVEVDAIYSAIEQALS